MLADRLKAAVRYDVVRAWAFGQSAWFDYLHTQFGWVTHNDLVTYCHRNNLC